eukprot:TRINITY_DN16744_c0_g1_i2.p1 TRINITY_DN16744_c0_g1~~TRINITY_DN16744_c0_g1_i2.p1  ORF type:complete len:657 (-),score=139.65 TRINITY_DN16744_c0_g1_i2:275-2245(-)
MRAYTFWPVSAAIAQEQAITDGTATEGVTVAIDGNTMILGNEVDSTSKGVSHVYTFVSDAPTSAPTTETETESTLTTETTAVADTTVAATVAASVTAGVMGSGTATTAGAATGGTTAASSTGTGSMSAAKASSLVTSLQGVVLFSQMNSVKQADAGAVGDSFKWAAFQQGPSVVDGDANAQGFVSCLIYVSVLVGLAAVHRLIEFLFKLRPILEFPIIELMVADVVFGALCTSASLVIDPNSNTAWEYAVAGWVVLVVLVMYVLFVGYMIRTNTSEFVVYEDVSWRDSALRGDQTGVWRPGEDQVEAVYVLRMGLQASLREWLGQCARCAVRHRICTRCHNKHVETLDKLSLVKLEMTENCDSIENPLKDTVVEILECPSTRLACPPQSYAPGSWDLQRDLEGLEALLAQAQKTKDYQKDATRHHRRYGIWFDMFRPGRAMVHAAALAAVLIQAVAIGVLQSYPKPQIWAVCGTDLALLLLWLIVFPENVIAEWPFVVASLLCQFGASAVMVLHVYEVGGLDTQATIGALLMGRISAQVGLVFMTLWWAIRNKLCAAEPEVDDSVLKPPPFGDGNSVFRTSTVTMRMPGLVEMESQAPHLTKPDELGLEPVRPVRMPAFIIDSRPHQPKPDDLGLDSPQEIEVVDDFEFAKGDIKH